MDADAVARLREYHAAVGLDESDLAPDPITQFEVWLRELAELGVPEPNAMVLSTADADGQPSSRHVLLKRVGAGGFVFFTNYGSRKGRELAANPRASLCFPWFCIGRQVIVTGVVTKVTEAETDEYFASRPHGDAKQVRKRQRSYRSGNCLILEERLARHVDDEPRQKRS